MLIAAITCCYRLERNKRVFFQIFSNSNLLVSKVVWIINDWFIDTKTFLPSNYLLWDEIKVLVPPVITIATLGPAPS